jgi:3-oxoacyl-[acyl-carrier protein] reductase
VSNKNIIIIGASSGIGLKTAQVLQEKSNNFIICSSRNIENFSKKELCLFDNTFLKNLDVTNETSVKNFFNFIEKKYKKIDAIINCAGYVEPKGLFEISSKNWNKTLEVNLTGTFNVAKYGCFAMKKSGGKLINIASTAGMNARPGWSAYAAAKAGVINFSLTIAEELKSYGIKVFVICPGRTATPLRKILAPNEDPQTIMQPEAVAKVITNLLENDMDVLEGSPIVVRERF